MLHLPRLHSVPGWIIFILFFGSALYGQGDFTPTEYIMRRIHIEGNERFSTRYLKKKLNLKDRWYNRSKTFTRRLIELDRILLETIYIKNGYLKCTVSDSFSVSDKGRVELFYTIREGHQYFLKNISVSGNRSLDEAEILKLLDHPLDKSYNPLRIRDGIKRIETAYANNGKPLAVVKDSIVVNSDIHLFLHITESVTMRVGQIRIANNELVKDKPIRRELVLRSGDLFSREKLDKSRKRIFETGLFSSVHIQLSNIDTAQKIVDLQVNVREMDMHYLGLNVGLGQDRGISSGSEPYTSFTMNGEWLHRNIAGRGSRLSTKLGGSLNLTDILKRPKTEAEILYVEPWLLGFRSSTSFRLFLNNQLLEDEEMTSYGGEVALTYQPDKRFLASSGIEIKHIDYRDLISGTQRDTSSRGNERAFVFNVRRDYRDNFLYPTRGTVFTFTGKLVGTLLGGFQEYYKFETSFSQYLPLVGPVVLAYRGKFGYADKPPLYEKFYLGGGTSMRGWGHQELPQDGALLREDADSNKEDENDYIIEGADLKVMTNAEIHFPLFWILGGEIFIDGGCLASDIKSLMDATYRWDAGIGLTIATPLGPIRIDYTKILNPLKNKEGEKMWQFSIHYAF